MNEKSNCQLASVANAAQAARAAWERTWRVFTPTAFLRVGLAILLVALAGCAFFYRMDKPSMWLDEVFHWSLTRASAWSLMNEGPLEWKQLAHLYYLSVKWCDAVFSNRDFAARLPQAASATLTVLFVYLLTRRLYTTGAAVLACVLVIADPLMVEYARQNRFYHMTSLGFIATLYYYLTFLETGRWRDWLGLVLAASFLLRVGSFGIMVMVALALITPLLFFLTTTAGQERAPYAVGWHKLVKLGLAALLILLLFMPYPVRLVRFYLATGGTTPAMDGFWSGPFPLTVRAIADFVHAKITHWPAVKELNRWYALVFIAAVAGSLAWRRGKALVFAAMCFLVTLPILYTMNKGQAEVMSKRFVYLWPCYYIFMSGGIAMLAYTAAEAVRALLEAVRSNTVLIKGATWAASIVVWLLIFCYTAWPLLRYHVHYVGNNYFSERHWYKQIARLVSGEVASTDLFWWNNTHNDYWLLEFPYWPPHLRVKPTPVMPHQLNGTLVQSSLVAHTAVWMHGIDPQQFGLSSGEVVRVPVARSTVWLCKASYRHNETLRDSDEKRLLRRVMEHSDFPEIEAARQLVAFYLQRGQTGEADRLMERLGAWRACYPAIESAYKYFKERGDELRARHIFARHADLYFWIPALQLEVARLAYAQGDYPGTVRYARRVAWFDTDTDGGARELIARAYLASTNYARAARWARAALRRMEAVQRVKKGQEARVQALQNLYRTSVLQAGTHALVEELVAAWEKRQNAGTLEDVLAYLTKARHDVREREQLQRVVRKRQRLSSGAYLLALWDAATTAQVYDTLIKLKTKTTLATWPFYVYAMAHSTPLEWQQVMMIPYDELPRRGFRLMHWDVEQWQMLERFYQARICWPAITGFYAFARVQCPTVAWWAALRESETAVQHGYTNNVVDLLMPYNQTYEGDMALAARVKNVMKHVALTK